MRQPDRIISRTAHGSTFEVHSVPLDTNPFIYGSKLAEVRSGPRTWDQGSPKLRCDPACLCPSNQAAPCCCFCVCCGYVGNAFALSKRSGISTVFAASILPMPARHAAMGNWLFIA